MMDEIDFDALVDEIMSQGIDEERAATYAGLIGDRPIKDADGNIVVMDHGRTIATLKPLKIFQ